MSAEYVTRFGVGTGQESAARVGVVDGKVFVSLADAGWVEALCEDDGPMWNTRKLSTAEARALAVALTCAANELS